MPFDVLQILEIELNNNMIMLQLYWVLYYAKSFREVNKQQNRDSAHKFWPMAWPNINIFKRDNVY